MSSSPPERPAIANDNNPPQNEDERPASTGVCPQCGKPRVEHYRPFCSRRCADIDLARWLGGRYAIPAREQDEDEDSARD